MTETFQFPQKRAGVSGDKQKEYAEEAARLCTKWLDKLEPHLCRALSEAALKSAAKQEEKKGPGKGAFTGQKKDGTTSNVVRSKHAHGCLSFCL